MNSDTVVSMAGGAENSVGNALRVRDACSRFNATHADLLADAMAETLSDRPDAGADSYGDCRWVAPTAANSLAGDIWSVTDHCASIIGSIAMDMPEPPSKTVSLSHFVQPTGFVHVPSCVQDHPINAEMPLMYHAISWYISEGSGHQILHVFPWVWTGGIPGMSGKGCLPMVPLVLPLDLSFELLKDYRWGMDGMWLLKWLLALFTWSSGEATEVHALKRSQIRQLDRRGSSATEVTVVKLRKLKSAGGTYHGGGTKELTDAHYRSGHWRWQPVGQGKKDLRLVWVRPTVVRGDLLSAGDSIPKPKQRVYSVDR